MGLAASFQHLRARIRRALAQRGLWATLRSLPGWVRHNARRWHPRQRRWEAELRRIQQQFDHDHGVDTAGIVQLSSLAVVGQHRDMGHYYHGTDPQAFAQMLAQLPIEHADYQFVDFGSGKGKALLLASLWPFSAVTGVEFAQALHTVAQQNIQRFRHAGQRCHQITSLHLDATQYLLPATPLVLYFYNPFGTQILAAIVRNIEASWAAQPRDIWVCYMHPYAHGPLDSAALLQPVHTHSQYRIYRTRPALV